MADSRAMLNQSPLAPRTDLSLLSRRCPVNRLLEAQAQEQGVEVEGLIAAEGRKAQAIDPRSGEQDVITMTRWHREAQESFFHPTAAPLSATAPRILLGPNSKVVDHVVSGASLQRLIAELVRQGQEGRLQEAIH